MPHAHIDPNGGLGRPYGLPLQAGEVAGCPRRKSRLGAFLIGLAVGLFFLIGAEVAMILRGMIG